MSASKPKAAAVKEKNSGQTAEKGTKTRTTLLVSAIVIVIIGVIAGIAIYRNRIAPFNTVVISVDDKKIDMRYFLKRLALSGENSFAMLSTLTQEEFLRRKAPEPPYSISVTEEDIDRYARDIARGSAETIDEREFREWYRQQLNESRFSDEEFRDLLRTSLLTERMTEYLGKNAPTVAEQVFINMIPVEDYDVAYTIKQKYEKGESFADLAKEYSTDARLAENGGKVGWFPKAALDVPLSYTAFDLEVGECSDPVEIGPMGEEQPVVIMISEKDPAREIEENAMQAVKASALEEWYHGLYEDYEVEFYGLDKTEGYDSETDAWVNWQLMRMRRDEEENMEQTS